MSQTSQVEMEDVTVHEKDEIWDWVEEQGVYVERSVCMTCGGKVSWPCPPEQIKRKDKKIRQLEQRLSNFRDRIDTKNAQILEVMQHNEALAEELEKVEKTLAELKDRGLTW